MQVWSSIDTVYAARASTLLLNAQHCANTQIALHAADV
jgi:hypothetical protein